ncbi:hypothetical protein C8R43DRAFT_1118509 [Mycena crocata]|nr:hypothetical protein C8R43DRAFT_1118509 [Mycena crocata]
MRLDATAFFASARRVHTELLVEMFDLTSTIDAYELFDDTTPEREVERLAKSNLLDLVRSDETHLADRRDPFQVCSHRYGVVMGTPRLWAAFAVDITLWSKSNGLDLVATLLQRSANFPLSIEIAVDYGGVARKLMALLVQHSHRWKEVYFWMDPRCFEFIAGIVSKYVAAPARVTTECVLMLLKSLRDWPPSAYISVTQPVEWPEDHAVARLLPTTSRFTLYIETESGPPPLALPYATSSVSKVTIVTTPSHHPSRAQGVLAAILGSVVLASLKDLRFLVRPREAHVVSAETTEFVGFASRSSLHDSLVRLEIRGVIQDAELLQCVSALPPLETFKIYDCEDHAVVTDHFLRRMTSKPDQENLIPRLSSLLTASLFRFQDAVLHSFIISRIICHGSDTKAFEIRLRWLPDGQRHPPLLEAPLTEFMERGI